MAVGREHYGGCVRGHPMPRKQGEVTSPPALTGRSEVQEGEKTMLVQSFNNQVSHESVSKSVSKRLALWVKFSADNILKYFFLFFSENRI